MKLRKKHIEQQERKKLCCADGVCTVRESQKGPIEAREKPLLAEAEPATVLKASGGSAAAPAAAAA